MLGSRKKMFSEKGTEWVGGGRNGRTAFVNKQEKGRGKKDSR